MAAANDSEELAKSLEAMTMSGSLGINPKDIKKLKLLCKKSQENVERCYRMLWTKISHRHIQVRLATMTIINEIYLRSHVFRELINENLHQLFDYVLDLEQKVKKPNKYHKQLKEKALEYIQNWNRQFGEGYPLLRAAYSYLKDKKLVNFEERIVINAETRRTEEERMKKENYIKLKIEKGIEEFEQIEVELNDLLKQIESCFELLMPRIEQQDNNEREEDGGEQSSSSNETLEIVIKPYIEVVKNKNTEAVIENLKGIHKEIMSIANNKLKKLLKTFSKKSEICESQLKRAIDLKWRISCTKDKFDELKILDDYANDNNSEDDSESDEFEEVPMKEDIELIIPDHLRHEYGLEPIPSTSKSNDEPSTINYDEKRCNAKLANGMLCPRRDKYICPFHGKILPRDLSGVPIDEEEKKREELEQAEKAADPQNPELLKQIKLLTGVDLTKPKSGRKKRFPGLEELNDDDTPRKRLKKIVFSKETVKRITDQLDNDAAKCQNSFGDQWNYAMKR